MSYSDDNSGWKDLEEDECPDMTTENGRDEWIEILASQDDDTLAQNNTGWCKALVVADEHGNMVMRIVYPDDEEEIFDLLVRRTIEVSAGSTPEERN